MTLSCIEMDRGWLASYRIASKKSPKRFVKFPCLLMWSEVLDPWYANESQSMVHIVEYKLTIQVKRSGVNWNDMV